MQTILETAASAGKFATLLSAIKAAGLTDSLNAKGPFTVFAPTDEAFRRLGAGSIEALLKDAPKLKKILSYHVVPGAINARDVRTGDIKSLEGSALAASAADGRVTLNDVRVVQADIAASNGVIHVIDGVLMPKGVTLAAAA